MKFLTLSQDIIIINLEILNLKVNLFLKFNVRFFKINIWLTNIKVWISNFKVKISKKNILWNVTLFSYMYVCPFSPKKHSNVAIYTLLNVTFFFFLPCIFSKKKFLWLVNIISKQIYAEQSLLQKGIFQFNNRSLFFRRMDMHVASSSFGDLNVFVMLLLLFNI